MHRLDLKAYIKPNFFVPLLMIPLTIAALPDDRNQPINLKAESASYDQKTGRSVYRGNVVVTQGSMYLAADMATVYFKDGEFLKMEATGKPTRFRYQPSLDKPPIDGTGSEIVYYAVDNKVVVNGNARFRQGGDEFKSNQIEYDLTRDVIKAGGGVEVIIQPRKQN